MSELSDRIRKTREAWVKHDGKEFLVLRPATTMLVAERHVEWIDLLVGAVKDWKDVKESDLVPDGKDVPIPFDAEAFREYAIDRSDLVKALSDHIQNSTRATFERQEAHAKN